jgi:hypothetical protein
MKKMFSITNHFGNINQNHSIISHHLEWLVSKRKIINVGKNAEKGELTHCWWKCKLLTHHGKLWRFVLRTTNEPTIGFSSPTTGYISKGTGMFLFFLFIHIFICTYFVWFISPPGTGMFQRQSALSRFIRAV